MGYVAAASLVGIVALSAVYRNKSKPQVSTTPAHIDLPASITSGAEAYVDRMVRPHLSEFSAQSLRVNIPLEQKVVDRVGTDASKPIIYLVGQDHIPPSRILDSQTTTCQMEIYKILFTLKQRGVNTIYREGSANSIVPALPGVEPTERNLFATLVIYGCTSAEIFGRLEPDATVRSYFSNELKARMDIAEQDFPKEDAFNAQCRQGVPISQDELRSWISILKTYNSIVAQHSFEAIHNPFVENQGNAKSVVIVTGKRHVFDILQYARADRFSDVLSKYTIQAIMPEGRHTLDTIRDGISKRERFEGQLTRILDQMASQGLRQATINMR